MITTIAYISAVLNAAVSSYSILKWIQAQADIRRNQDTIFRLNHEVITLRHANTDLRHRIRDMEKGRR